ncbi:MULTISPECIES: GntR family transcriptional regulator [Streptosporangium]|uniref:DNA-binding GntR family transcriptional regulator n=1 Tax=Streptosporangium brasiliense TaxID=47480 RepID=A0ABT9RFM4_9ACTN|nr:GntR family transcriptional regulator [Streptosporangium brasiliense]MDP9867651.1 DNA-binding GntR family transcriptional regulator [Streptosporangium brasiliense]
MHGDTVYRRLREQIVAGHYPPGERLTELSASAALEVSRTPVREALRRLESDGLVRSTGRGVVVTGLSPDSLDHAYAVRAALETLTAELAADRQRDGRIPPAALAELEDSARRLEQVTAAGDLDRAIGLNRDFHRTVAELAGNPIALETLDRLWDQIIVSTRATLTAPERPEAVADEHRRLLAAIRDGRRELAGRIAGDHARATGAARTRTSPAS